MIEPPPAPSDGALTPGWRWTLGLAWFGVVVGFSVVSRSSRELGLPTWWLGPSSDPQPYPIMAAPFLVPAAVVALTFTRLRWTPWAAIGAGAIMTLIALGDVVGDHPRFGAVEVALAVAGAAVGAVSLTGRHEPSPQTSPDDAAPQPGHDPLGAAPDELTAHEGDSATGR